MEDEILSEFLQVGLFEYNLKGVHVFDFLNNKSHKVIRANKKWNRETKYISAEPKKDRKVNFSLEE